MHYSLQALRIYQVSPSSAGVGHVMLGSTHTDGVMHVFLVQAERLERDGDAYVTRCMAAFQHEVAAMLPVFLQQVSAGPAVCMPQQCGSRS